jgi:hypothetical protein
MAEIERLNSNCAKGMRIRSQTDFGLSASGGGR